MPVAGAGPVRAAVQDLRAVLFGDLLQRARAVFVEDQEVIGPGPAPDADVGVRVLLPERVDVGGRQGRLGLPALSHPGMLALAAAGVAPPAGACPVGGDVVETDDVEAAAVGIEGRLQLGVDRGAGVVLEVKGVAGVLFAQGHGHHRPPCALRPPGRSRVRRRAR
jgi:hypothetical protein